MIEKIYEPLSCHQMQLEVYGEKEKVKRGEWIRGQEVE